MRTSRRRLNGGWCTRAAQLAAAVLVLVLPGRALAGPTGEPEPELRAALRAAMNEPAGFDDRYGAEVWLVDMSARMQRYLPTVLPDPAERITLLRRLHAEAARAKVSPELVLSVIQIESRFNRYAISRSGAEGLMQIMPFWLDEIGQTGDNLFDPAINLRMGCTILRFYLDREHDGYVKALARYNGSGGKPDYPYLVLNTLNRRWSPF